jgi:hypothetical protein
MIVGRLWSRVGVWVQLSGGDNARSKPDMGKGGRSACLNGLFRRRLSRVL